MEQDIEMSERDDRRSIRSSLAEQPEPTIRPSSCGDSPADLRPGRGEGRGNYYKLLIYVCLALLATGFSVQLGQVIYETYFRDVDAACLSDEESLSLQQPAQSLNSSILRSDDGRIWFRTAGYLELHEDYWTLYKSFTPRGLKYWEPSENVFLVNLQDSCVSMNLTFVPESKSGRKKLRLDEISLRSDFHRKSSRKIIKIQRWNKADHIMPVVFDLDGPFYYKKFSRALRQNFSRDFFGDVFLDLFYLELKIGKPL